MNIYKTQFLPKEKVDRKWYVIDATGKTLGRLCSKIALKLQGKDKPNYTPHVDNGDFIIVINAEKIRVTGNKLEDKMYYHHSGYPGGLRETNLKKLLQTYPERVIMYATKGMLPKNRLGRKMLKKLKVYAGPEHPHKAQKPTPLDI